MLFSQVASFALFFFGIGSAAASPTPNEGAIVARQDTDLAVSSILQTLQGQNNDTLTQINNLVNSDNANDDTIAPLIADLVDSIQSAASLLGAIPPSRRNLKRDVVSDVAVLLASIIRDLAITLNSLLSVKTISTLKALLVSVDAAVKGLLVSVNVLVVGVLITLEGLLADVSAILTSLGLTLTTLLPGL